MYITNTEAAKLHFKRLRIIARMFSIRELPYQRSYKELQSFQDQILVVSKYLILFYLLALVQSSIPLILNLSIQL
jgi:hypothetical protein